MQQGKRASAPPDEQQSSKRTVTIPIVYQESAFQCGFQCDADRLLDEKVQVLALRQGMIALRQQYNIDSVDGDWWVACPRDARAQTMTADTFLRMGQSICLSLKPHAEGKGLSAQIQSRDGINVQLNATITELQTQLEAVSTERDTLQTQLTNVSAGCPKCVLLEQRIEQQDRRIEEQTRRIADLEEENNQLKKRCTVQDRLIAELRGQIQSLQDQVHSLQQPARKMQAIVRRIAVIKARHTIIQRVGRSISNDMTWNEYYESLTTLERESSGVESSAVWRKLASGKKVGNEAAHVASKGEVAEAVCAAQEGKESWYAIFHLAYGEDPESIFSDE